MTETAEVAKMEAEVEAEVEAAAEEEEEKSVLLRVSLTPELCSSKLITRSEQLVTW